MLKKAFAILSGLTLTCGVAWGQGVPSTSRPILSGPLAKLDIKDAQVEAGRGTRSLPLRPTNPRANGSRVRKAWSDASRWSSS